MYLYRHIIHQNDPEVKLEIMVMPTDVYPQRKRRKRPHRLHPEAQERAYMDILYIKMTQRPSRT